VKWRGTYRDTTFQRVLRNGLASWCIWCGFAGCSSPWFMVFYIQIFSLFVVLTAIERRMGNG